MNSKRLEGALLVAMSLGLIVLGGCAKQLQRIETGVGEVSREQQAQRRAMQQFQLRLDELAQRDAEREEQIAERRAELEAQLLALDRAVRQMDARSEEQAQLLQQIRGALDIIARQRVVAESTGSAEDRSSSGASVGDVDAADGGDSIVTDGDAGGSPGTDVYESAFADYTRGSYTLARQGFEELLQRFPKSELADDAAYWIAETHYAQGDPQTALNGFRSILEEYPRGDSITPSLLKIGYCYLELENTEAARESFRRLVREFPESDEALIAQHKLSTMSNSAAGG